MWQEYSLGEDPPEADVGREHGVIGDQEFARLSPNLRVVQFAAVEGDREVRRISREFRRNSRIINYLGKLSPPFSRREDTIGVSSSFEV